MNPAGLFLVTVMLVGCALDTEALPATTTTTTTTTSQPEIKTETGSECECCPWFACMDTLLPYNYILMSHDFNRLADQVDTLCGSVIPTVEECQRNANSSDCGSSDPLAYFRYLCSMQSEVNDGRACWATEDYQSSMIGCSQEFQRVDWSTLEGRCQGVTDLKECVRVAMEQLSSCTTEDANFIRGFLNEATLAVCPADGLLAG